jgi:dTDP-4-dehydrorhamnose 3,5-epimerase
MRFLATALPGVHILEQERHADARGYFARTWCAKELLAQGLDASLLQSSVSFNHKKATLRGLHYQAPPYSEVKVVRCARGALFDVAVDIRPDSPSFRKWVGVELSADNGRALYIPKGFAHGFYTLADDTEVEYFISTEYRPDAARGLRYNDAFFDVKWPGVVSVIAERDRDYPDATLPRLEEMRGQLA